MKASSSLLLVLEYVIKKTKEGYYLFSSNKSNFSALPVGSGKYNFKSKYLLLLVLVETRFVVKKSNLLLPGATGVCLKRSSDVFTVFTSLNISGLYIRGEKFKQPRSNLKIHYKQAEIFTSPFYWE